ncbi:MAG: hypothetical protein R6V17_00875 [Halanaerobacter sp.]
MTKLLLSVRITEKYFSTAQIESLEQELDSFNSKSEFMRKIIKFYLKHNNSDLELDSPSTSTSELQELLEENNSLLQQLASKAPSSIKQTKMKSTTSNIDDNKKVSTTYQGEEQQDKTEQALSLLDQF